MKAGFDFRTLIGEFLEWRSSRHLSPRTIENDRCRLTFFRKWCEERGIYYPATVSKHVLTLYFSFLYHYRKKDGDFLKKEGRNQKIIIIFIFYKWLAKNRLIADDPTRFFNKPRSGHHLPAVLLTTAEIERIMDQPKVNTVIGLRDRAMLETFYSTGIRCRELARLKKDDLRLATRTLFIRQGKGRKDRLVPVGERACRWLQRYTIDARPSLVRIPESAALFLSNNTGHALKPTSISIRVRHYIKSSGTTKPGSCHLFRHALATGMLDNGADIRYIQAILGHVKLQSTQIYTQVSIKSLKQIHQKTHPFERNKHLAIKSQLSPEF